MYDILQLNDMLVPELLDIAKQLNIPDAKKLTKQELVYRILDSQAIAGYKDETTETKTKKKRNVKTTSKVGTEEDFVEDEGTNKQEKENKKKKAKAPAKKAKAAAKKKKTTTKKEEEETVAESEEKETKKKKEEK